MWIMVSENMPPVPPELSKFLLFPLEENITSDKYILLPLLFSYSFCIFFFLLLYFLTMIQSSLLLKYLFLLLPKYCQK